MDAVSTYYAPVDPWCSVRELGHVQTGPSLIARSSLLNSGRWRTDWRTRASDRALPRSQSLQGSRRAWWRPALWLCRCWRAQRSVPAVECICLSLWPRLWWLQTASRSMFRCSATEGGTTTVAAKNRRPHMTRRIGLFSALARFRRSLSLIEFGTLPAAAVGNPPHVLAGVLDKHLTSRPKRGSALSCKTSGSFHAARPLPERGGNSRNTTRTPRGQRAKMPPPKLV